MVRLLGGWWGAWTPRLPVSCENRKFRGTGRDGAGGVLPHVESWGHPSKAPGEPSYLETAGCGLDWGPQALGGHAGLH